MKAAVQNFINEFLPEIEAEPAIEKWNMSAVSLNSLTRYKVLFIAFLI